MMQDTERKTNHEAATTKKSSKTKIYHEGHEEHEEKNLKNTES